ncbi:MAG TPA: RHS repeat-associated core domain-containing protein [Phycisphaerales bacterium]|nr:RHS repeat-associated core domain-containing protein [Phycisphaerales bacterium]
MKHTAYGKPYLVPFKEMDKNGTVDSSDRTAFDTRINGIGAGYDVRTDAALFDGVVDSKDLTNYDNETNAPANGLGILSSPGIVRNFFGYGGYRWDDVVLHYEVRHRYYTPTQGRWLQRDPLGYVDGLGLYAYCAGRALTARDPFGLACESERAEYDAAKAYLKLTAAGVIVACAGPRVVTPIGALACMVAVAAHVVAWNRFADAGLALAECLAQQPGPGGPPGENPGDPWPRDPIPGSPGGPPCNGNTGDLDWSLPPGGGRFGGFGEYPCVLCQVQYDYNSAVCMYCALTPGAFEHCKEVARNILRRCRAQSDRNCDNVYNPDMGSTYPGVGGGCNGCPGGNGGDFIRSGGSLTN